MKNVIITGASRGIGRAMAIEFAKRGFNLCLLARREELLNELKSELETYKIDCIYKKCDVTKSDDVKSAIDYALEEFKTIDIAILNSGIGGSDTFKDFKHQTLEDIYNVNVFGITRFMEHLVPIMREQKSGIIAGMSSLADARGIPGSTAYSSGKSALSCILEGARLELKDENIHIVTIRPGFIKSDITAKNDFHMPFLYETDEAAKYMIDRILQGKRRISFPAPMVFITYLVRAIPSIVFEKLFRNVVSKK